jgi:MYXO-CTERM domain-containing protein
MRQLQTDARFGLLMSALALMSVPSAALAQDAACDTDADCEHGYTCEVVGGGCPDIACAEGSECPPQDCDTMLGCLPARDCEADSDCATGWKCATEQYSDCADAGFTCAEGEECVKPDLPPASDCETREISFCAPPWTLPCESATDCGAGFECVERIAMSCSNGGSAGEPTPSGDPVPPDDGSSGFAPPADGDPVPPEEEMPSECTSEPSGEFYCQLIETTCNTDADCAAGLTCQEQYGDSVSCGGATPDVPPEEGNGSGGAGGAGAGGDSGGSDDPDQDRALPADCIAPAPTYACAPPGYNSGYGYDLDGRGEAAAGTADPDQSAGDSNNENGEEPPAAPTDDDSELSTGDGNAAGMSESSGCSTTGRSGSSGSMMLMALAVLGLALRRRVAA